MSPDVATAAESATALPRPRVSITLRDEDMEEYRLEVIVSREFAEAGGVVLSGDRVELDEPEPPWLHDVYPACTRCLEDALRAESA